MTHELEPSTAGEREEAALADIEATIKRLVKRAHGAGLRFGPTRMSILRAYDEAVENITLPDRLEALAATVPDRDVVTVPKVVRDTLREAMSK